MFPVGVQASLLLPEILLCEPGEQFLVFGAPADRHCAFEPYFGRPEGLPRLVIAFWILVPESKRGCDEAMDCATPETGVTDDICVGINERFGRNTEKDFALLWNNQRQFSLR